jgi:hypothetical protein
MYMHIAIAGTRRPQNHSLWGTYIHARTSPLQVPGGHNRTQRLVPFTHLHHHGMYQDADLNSTPKTHTCTLTLTHSRSRYLYSSHSNIHHDCRYQEASTTYMKQTQKHLQVPRPQEACEMGIMRHDKVGMLWGGRWQRRGLRMAAVPRVLRKDVGMADRRRGCALMLMWCRAMTRTNHEICTCILMHNLAHVHTRVQTYIHASVHTRVQTQIW